jgi:patatin-like phospholipase/acyl hydrolase
MMEDRTPLRILSLDGGGVRGLSSLVMLNAIIAEMQLKLVHEFKPLKPIPPIRPCQIFDLICGTSTGGLIAIMLGRLQMVFPPEIGYQIPDLFLDCR